MQHQTLGNGRWTAMTLPQQMANIGSETSRVYKALAASKDDRAEKAFERFQELIDLTIKYGRSDNPKTSPALFEELCRVRELYCLAFANKNLPDLLAFNRYFDRFAFVKG